MADPVYKPVFGHDKIAAYLERANLFFTANGIGEDKRVSVFLVAIGTKNYDLIKSLTAHTLPQDKSYADLQQILKNHFQPKPLVSITAGCAFVDYWGAVLVIAERYRFYQRTQAVGDSVLDFLADLRRLAITCEFGNFLDEALQDRFVCELKAEGIQKRLLTEPDLTIARAVEVARGMEAAASETKEFKGSNHNPTSKIFQMSGSTPPERQGCHRCGKSDHDGRTCKFRQAKCHSCGKIGHIAPVWRSGQSKRPRNRRGRQNSKKTNLVTAEGQATAELDSELATHACTIMNPFEWIWKYQDRS